MFERFAALRPSTAVSWLALAVALGGTAVAATTTLVTISDKTGSRTAGVDVFNRLRTAAAPVAASGSFSWWGFLYASSWTTVLGPSKASIVITNMDFGNFYDQYSGAKVRFVVSFVSGPNSNCSSPTYNHPIGSYYVVPGQTTSIEFPAGLNLKPRATGDTWCLWVSYNLQGNLSGYYTPEFGVAGYVESGAFSAPAASAAAMAGGLPPRNR